MKAYPQTLLSHFNPFIESKKEGYDMTKNPRGECLIISNRNFQKANSVRKGAEQDVEQLRKTFQWLQFNVNIEEDCSATQIKQHIDKYSKMSHESFDCFVCCILSHGNLEEIHGVDGDPIYTYNIMKSFEKCETLVGKPKLFFIQACRTKDDDKGLMPQAAADYAFGYASPPGI